MDSDFKPAQRPAKSLRAVLDERATDSPPIDTEATGVTENLPAAAPETSEGDIETINMAELPGGESVAAKPKGQKTDWRKRLVLHWPPGRKEWLVAAAAILLIGGSTGLALVLTHHSKPVATVKTVVKAKLPPKPTTVPSDLSGLPVAPSVNQLPVTAVMIENSIDARPQSGLGQASVVFEAIAEGGVTRFMALYQDTSPSNVGPIRSARPYYIQWDLGFNAPYAHVGGSPDGLADIKAWGVEDLDEFANGGSYHRISTREAPHNVYTAISTLNQLETSKGYLHSTFTGFVRKAKEQPAKTPTAASIDLTLSGPIYNPHYDYVAATNSYNRSEDGAPQIDANTNQQISPKVVIAMVVPESLGALDATGAYYSDYNVIGSGPVDVFQDGTVTTGSWTKAGNTNPLTFADSNGQPIKLNSGTTWITAVTAASDISFAP